MPEDSDAVTRTIAYYEAHGRSYADETWGLDLAELYGPFEQHLPSGGRVLDAGCGSGRDTLYFLQRGYDVTAFDASEEMVRVSTARTGLETLRLRFDEVVFEREFDGVWACASLLHVPTAHAVDAHARLARSLRVGGVLYASYKYGENERVDSGRFFRDYDEASIGTLVNEVPLLSAEAVWTTADVRAGVDGRWLNILFRSTR